MSDYGQQFYPRYAVKLHSGAVFSVVVLSLHDPINDTSSIELKEIHPVYLNVAPYNCNNFLSSMTIPEDVGSNLDEIVRGVGVLQFAQRNQKAPVTKIRRHQFKNVALKLMFSHRINNPKNIKINQKDYHMIPFGHRCTSALACKYANIRKFSLPFDWAIPFYPETIQRVLEGDFEGFLDYEYTMVGNKRKTKNGKYGTESFHYDENIVETMKRRIERFRTIMNGKTKLYFVYVNEDYLYYKNYRVDGFNKNLFDNMLKLEKYIKNKYEEIDYNILYFDFKEHKIPADSNLINIIIKTGKYYDSPREAPMAQLRNYCGKILTILYNTNLTLGYTDETFKD